MYEQFFGLKRPPFKITPDTSLFYDGGRRGDVLGALVYAVQRGEGIVKVVGEVGSGKTMLCRMMQQELPSAVEIIYIANPSVSAEDILFVIAHELKLDVQKDSTKHEVMHMLQDHLLKRFTGNRQVVLFVEEAQGMPLETLEEIRLLSNLETDQDKLLQIILFGQPELDENLKTPSIRQLKERITHEFNLTPLSNEEIHTYLNFRMREVGYTGPELIDSGVAKIVGKYSGGLLRRINIIADKVLLSAFAESTHNITAKHVKAAVKDSGFERSVDGRKTGGFNPLLLLSAVIMLLLILLILSGKSFNLSMVDSELEVPKNEVVTTQTTVVEKKPEIKLVVNLAVASKEDIIAAPESKSNELVIIAAPESKSNELVIIAEEQSKSPQESAKLVDGLAAVVMGKKKNSSIDEIEEHLVMAEKPKKNQNSSSKSTNIVKQDADENNKVAALNNEDWLDWKLQQSKVWLKQQKNRGVSIQVMMRNKSAADELANVLRGQWPLDVERTHLYEVQMNERIIYRVFFGEFESLTLGRQKLKNLPEAVRFNEPYLHSLYKMKKMLL